jgi:hypothetical protein
VPRSREEQTGVEGGRKETRTKTLRNEATNCFSKRQKQASFFELVCVCDRFEKKKKKTVKVWNVCIQSEIRIFQSDIPIGRSNEILG